MNVRGLETENIDFWRSGEVRGEKILNFKSPKTENIVFWRSGEDRGAVMEQGGPRISGPKKEVGNLVGKKGR